MKKLVCYTEEGCYIRYACQAVEGKWKLPMMYVLCQNGTLRYNELKRALGITNMMLSATLKDLEEEGLILRVQYNEIPPRVEYSLTELGSQLMPVLAAFDQWGQMLAENEKHDGDE
jgi:DNA-binding HxlR family transcriptional regulator